MSKKKKHKKSKSNRLETIALANAIINLITALLILLQELLE